MNTYRNTNGHRRLASIMITLILGIALGSLFFTCNRDSRTDEGYQTHKVVRITTNEALNVSTYNSEDSEFAVGDTIWVFKIVDNREYTYFSDEQGLSDEIRESDIMFKGIVVSKKIIP